MSTQCAKIAKVDVRLLGPFSIRQDGSAIEDRLTGPARALCIYLMVNAGQDFSREHLICAIWPEDKPPHPVSVQHDPLAAQEVSLRYPRS